jgi:c-di-GMP-binding flagellar brake protein YcgR
VVAEVELEDDTLIGETRDISEGGVAVILDAPIDEGSEVALVLVLTHEGVEDPDQDPLDVRASVMWCAPTEDGRAMMGLRFAGLEGDQRARLTRFLAALR